MSETSPNPEGRRRWRRRSGATCQLLRDTFGQDISMETQREREREEEKEERNGLQNCSSPFQVHINPCSLFGLTLHSIAVPLRVDAFSHPSGPDRP